jgi:hypothetical protein
VSDGNGVVERPVIRIGRKGKMRVAIGETGEPFEFDVIVTSQQWWDMDGTFRDEDGKLPRDKWLAHRYAAWAFVMELSGARKGTDGKWSGGKCPDLTVAEALEFLKHLDAEVDRLQSFFERASKDEPSSPESTTTLHFST